MSKETKPLPPVRVSLFAMLIMIIVFILLTACLLLTTLATPASASDDCPPEPPVYATRIYLPVVWHGHYGCYWQGVWIDCENVPMYDSASPAGE